MTQNTYEEGRLLLINKPVDWTSFDVVKKLRYTINVKKIGHAGTLDPLATGLLIIGTGKFTKKLNELQGLDKTYEGIIEIGKTTPSYDLETAFDSEKDWSGVTNEMMETAREQLTGDIQQIPPAHSAIKVGGERAYKKARKNKAVKLEPRTLTIHDFQIDYSSLPEVKFKVSCSKGTYIRSLAHDFGQLIGVGGYLKKLVRTSVGEYELSDAVDLDEFIKQHNEGR
ncbi:tRNA pseudouridine55 synthase [Ekhidna lutea]|uniref:tRNA pseudouridine synthase B n=1 Tax=Ekhidna lutea TaxID=447679 RepID=A0A239L930_EKHLU|nr:tRNA pseudouridine(55) synthase TruB [Ekhidna lutea]SNT26492.1 tRNA pseudouridine55 synthase [Ekhidna lutea]